MQVEMRPIVVDEGGVILTGHTRYEAAIKLGMTAVDVVDGDSPSARAECDQA